MCHAANCRDHHHHLVVIFAARFLSISKSLLAEPPMLLKRRTKGGAFRASGDIEHHQGRALANIGDNFLSTAPCQKCESARSVLMKVIMWVIKLPYLSAWHQ
jgi:hypothetical protein